MRIHADRLWMIGGAIVVALVVALTWLVLVADQKAQADVFHADTDAAHTQAGDLRGRIVKLKKDQARIGALTRERDALQAALPDDSGVPEFLRQMQSSGTAVGVDVSGITVGVPAAVEEVPGVWSLSIELTAEGTVTTLGDFLDQLQEQSQKRAVLIGTAALDSAGAEADKMRLGLTIKAFVAPPAGAGAPTVTTD